ncbi:hypothetical protein XENOCAPTIV_025427 [Xenoophorus captivus]|uniref:Uncharacterized protein n=1 Tax=Xenoophorus captivus TaxID=1517983 RepID=A0ABV0RLL3_9TELE
MVGLKVSNSLRHGQWNDALQAVKEAEFDGQPLGVLNAELYTILFSCLQRWGTSSPEEETCKQCVCMRVCVPTLNVEPWPQFASTISSEMTVGGSVYVRQKERCRETLRFGQQLVFRVLTATYLKSTRRSMHTSAFPCLSVKGLREPSKRGKKWPGACWVPLLATGGQGQIKTVRAS